MDETLIALDLETTGLSPEQDEIIEVAAVKFQGSSVLDVYQSLVDPGRPVPYSIEVLTGISSRELREAPPWPIVAAELEAFLGPQRIIGHHIAFDLGFLAQKGLALANPAYDTEELAWVLLPRLPDCRLVTVSQHLGTSTRPCHRALPDAQAAREVFLSLVDKLQQLPPSAISQINQLGRAWDWPLAPLFQDIERSFRARRQIAAQALPRGITRPAGRRGPLTPALLPQPLDIARLTSLLEPGGILEGAFPGYEPRPGQVQMMQAVAQALNQKEHLMVEAGTGIGKSLAYLLPSLFYSLENNVPVVISTNTINLQEQLLGKDIPELLRALGLSASELGVMGLKGRSNYLCLKRWQALLHSPALTRAQARLLVRTVVWLNEPTCGDRSEISLAGEEALAWSWIAAPEGGCPGEGCPYQQDGSCFLHQARQRAEGSRLIVVNHALLLSDIARGSQVLPQFRHLIIDEAHHLEAEATEQFGFRLSIWQVLELLGRLGGKVAHDTPSGFLTELEIDLGRSIVAWARRRELRQHMDDLRREIREAGAKAERFFDRLSKFVLQHTGETGEYERRLRVTRAQRAQPGWDGVEAAAQELGLALGKIESGLDRLYIALEGLEELEDYHGWRQELVWLGQTCSQLRGQVATVSCPEPETVYWGSWNAQEGVTTWCAAPVSVAQILERSLFSEKDCVVMTSATLSSQGSFEYIKGRLGCEGARELEIGSPFDYEASTLIYLPLDFPEPDHPSYQQAMGQTLVELCRATGGRTLALFTSASALRATHAAIQSPLSQAGILVLGQGIDGSAKQLLETLKTNPRTVLLGTSSFWEGVDVMGSSLSLLVIARLPFAVPTDPVFEARAERYQDSFSQYTLPQAVLRFKQGFGRLIRSHRDRGVVVVVDSRLHSRPYGRAFLDSLPRCKVKQGLTRELVPQVLKWLGG
ncbi:MAG TPA: hypothetical protein G4O03_05205 [Dehalococcoidia bacterium]|nr:hypothetical protein [Dehalococcoidia bacterium]